MSDWNRSGRDDDRRRYGQEERGDWNARDRRAEADRQRREQRSFDDHSRGQDWRDERGPPARPGHGDYGAPRYGAQGRGYGAREEYEDSRPRDQATFVGGNPALRRIEDGEADPAMRSAWGRGDHRGRGPKNYTRSDDRVREDVNDRLSDDAWLDASEIVVEVAACEVTLGGTVYSREDRRRAEDLAEQVLGVKHVQNNLRVEQNPQAWAPAPPRSGGIA